MKYFYTLLFLVGSTIVSAQTGTIKGKLADSSARQNLQSATVSVLNSKDSSVATYGITKPDGSFLLSNITNGDYLVLFTFQGYQSLYKNVVISKASPSADLHTIYLQAAAHDLGNINVQASPVVIKKDTVEMSANMFKTKPNAVAEDLFKKLPGVEVASDGSVKAQGEAVTKILVDGKRFFGTDPKMATRNIPTDMIDKVQVYDALSDQSTFSGFDDGNREKTINIITKKDRRKGYFGKGAAGVGTDGRYAANISANRFNGNQQISFVGQANNVNQQNFSIQDILGGGNNGGNRGGGGGGGMFGGGGGGNRGGGGGGGNFLSASGSGIARTLAAGLNYSDAWSKFTAVNGSYFYNNMNTHNDQDQLTENFVKGDASLFTSNIYRSNNKNQNHRFNFEIDQKLDTMNSILIRPTYSNQQTDNFSTSNSTTTRGTTIPVNAVNSTNASKSEGYNFNNTVLLRHKFQKKGRTVSLNLTQGLSQKVINSTTLSYNTTYRNNVAFKDTTNQLSHTDQDGKSYGATLSYTEPMGIKGQLEANYSYNYSLNNSNQSTMKFNKASGKFDIINSTLTNDFENTNISNRFSLNYRRQISNEFNYIIGAGVQKADLTSFNRTKDSTLTHDFFNFFPTFSLQYNKNRTKNLRLRYQGSTQQPSLTQLQPVIDNSNQLNITSGNPNLKQEFRHNINLFYSKFDVVTFKNVFASINGSFSQNKIGNEVTLNSDTVNMFINGVKLIPGAQFVRPVNINGAYNFSGFFNYGFPVKALKGNLNLTSNVSHSKDVGLLNNEKTISKTYVLGETVRLTMNLKERFDLNFSSTSTYNIVHYTNSNNQNTNYLTQTFAVEPTYSTKNNGWIFGSDFNYLRSSGQAEGYNQSIALWNASIAKTAFKNKAGEFKLSVFDLLNQNQSISRTATTTYVQDVKTTVLKRYVMLTFTYNLRKFGQQQQQQRGPGMFNNFQRGEGGGRPGGMPGGGFRRDN